MGTESIPKTQKTETQHNNRFVHAVCRLPRQTAVRGALLQSDYCSSHLGGCSQTIWEVKMLDVEVLRWYGYMWSAVVHLQ